MFRLTQEREAHGWSRSELSHRAGMTGASVGAIELGRLRPYESQLRKLAAALEWEGDPAALMEEIEGPPWAR